jgi:hypothetical protein
VSRSSIIYKVNKFRSLQSAGLSPESKRTRLYLNSPVGIIFYYYNYYYLVLRLLALRPLLAYLCQPRVIVKMIVEQQMECRLAGETEVLGENVLQRHFCPSQNPK